MATEVRRLRPGQGLALLVAMLAVANIVRTAAVPGAWDFLLNIGVAIAALAIAASVGVGVTELGLARRDLAAGLRFGGVAFAIVTVVVAAGAAVGALDDDRARVGWAEMLGRALVVIPIGTVLVEELAFRGVLQALLQRITTPARTLAIGAVLFGLWHVYPATRTTSAIGVVGTFGATAAAGVVFGWLRARSGSLIAPVLAHVATNSVTFALAWAVT